MFTVGSASGGLHPGGSASIAGVCIQAGLHPGGGLHRGGGGRPPLDTAGYGKWTVVRILLECILVVEFNVCRVVCADKLGICHFRWPTFNSTTTSDNNYHNKTSHLSQSSQNCIVVKIHRVENDAVDSDTFRNDLQMKLQDDQLYFHPIMILIVIKW